MLMQHGAQLIESDNRAIRHLYANPLAGVNFFYAEKCTSSTEKRIIEFNRRTLLIDIPYITALHQYLNG